MEAHPVAQLVEAKPANTSSNWDLSVPAESNIDNYTKGGFAELKQRLGTLNPALTGVLVFKTGTGSRYYPDREMLAYLSYAATKIRYLVLVDANDRFVGMLSTVQAISGISSGSAAFSSFGDKLADGRWRSFPGLVAKEAAFSKPPTIKELYEGLRSRRFDLPLLRDGKLVGILDYKSVADALYAQVAPEPTAAPR